MGRAPHNILVLTYWDVEEPLIVNYTLPYVEILLEQLPEGSTVHLVTLDRPASGPRRPLEMAGVVHHSYTYSPFGWRAVGMVVKLLFSLLGLVRREGIHTLHAWCTPAGGVGFLLSKLTGRPLVVDSYEPHAEAMVESGTWRNGGMAHRLLFALEKWQTRRAVAVVAATEGMRHYALERYGHVPSHYWVKPACVDLRRFPAAGVKRADLVREMNLEGKLVAVYAGKFGGMYLKQEVFDLFAVAREKWGGRFHVLLLTVHGEEELLPWIEKAGLPRSMFTIRYAHPTEVPDLMGLADWALNPMIPIPSRRYCTPLKDGEYWASGLPVMITPDISDDSRIIEEHRAGVVLRTLDGPGYRDAVEQMDQLLAGGDRQQIYRRIRPLAERYRSFDLARQAYAGIYGPGGLLDKVAS